MYVPPSPAGHISWKSRIKEASISRGSQVLISKRRMEPLSVLDASQDSFTVNESEAKVRVGPSGLTVNMRATEPEGYLLPPAINVTWKSRTIFSGYTHASNSPLSFPSRPE